MTQALRKIAIVGAGPAGLMAAETFIREAEGKPLQIDVFDAMPTAGRKFLLAGRGGLNLTHAEALAAFQSRFGTRSSAVGDWLAAFGPSDVREWAHGLGVETFVGSSDRVFPKSMKAAPLLRAWLARLRAAGVRFHMRHRWQGWSAEGALQFESPTGATTHTADATVLALGGASWPRLGSDGAWVPMLQAAGAGVAPLVPSNCGFDAISPRVAGGEWSEKLRVAHAGQPVKPVALRAPGFDGGVWRQGEFVLTETGIEGSLVYAASSAIRDAIAATGQAQVELDLLPAKSAAEVLSACSSQGRKSLSSHLQSRLNLPALKIALLYELLSADALKDPRQVARFIKALPMTLSRARPIAEAISTAGGVTLESLDSHLTLSAKPGVFCAGEMLDWEAPTGGYLLTACMASGVVAARGALKAL